MEKFGSVFQQHEGLSSHPRTGWEVGSGMQESPLWTPDGGNAPFTGFRLVSGYCQLGVAGALNPLPACSFLLWDSLRTPPKTQLQWFGPLCALLGPGTWRTVSFPGTIGGLIKVGPTVLWRAPSLPPWVLSLPPPYCFILWGGRGMAGPAGLGDTLIW